MSFPTLKPASTTSAIILPSTGNTDDVVATLAINFYGASDSFVTGAAAQVAYTYKRLGGDVLDIELTADNVYNHYEEAVLEYSYILNLHQARNALGSALGGETGSFDHKGNVTGTDSVSLKYPKFVFDYAFRVADKFSTESGIGGTTPIYSASFDMVVDKQDYDLQAIVSSSAEAGGVPYADFTDNTKDKTKRIKIRNMYYVSPHQMWRFWLLRWLKCCWRYANIRPVCR